MQDEKTPLATDGTLPHYASVGKGSAALGVSRFELYKRIQLGVGPKVVRIGTRILIPVDELSPQRVAEWGSAKLPRTRRANGKTQEEVTAASVEARREESPAK